MRIKLDPVKWNPNATHNFPVGTKADTEIAYLDENTLVVDGIAYEFDPLDVAFPGLSMQTLGVLMEAHREAGELFITVRRFYTGSCSDWDTGDYQEVTI